MNRIVISTVIIALVCLTSCTSKPEVKKEASNFTATNPVVIDTSVTKEYVSQIKSVRNIEIRALEKGFLQHIYVDEGESVKAGLYFLKSL